MKKIFAIGLILLCLLALSGCASENIATKNKDQSSAAIVDESKSDESTRGGENSKTLSEFLPKTDDFIQSLKKEKLITDAMNIVNDTSKNRYRIEVYDNETRFQNYYINIYYNSSSKVYKVEVSQYNYDLDAAPISIFLKGIPKSLFDEPDLLSYIKENGKTKTSEETIMTTTKKEDISYSNEGISYVYSKTSGSQYEWVEFYAYVDVNYKIDDQ